MPLLNGHNVLLRGRFLANSVALERGLIIYHIEVIGHLINFVLKVMTI